MGSVPGPVAAAPSPSNNKQAAYDSFTFNLAKHKPDKTVDVGSRGVSLSLDAQSRVLQASAYHPSHGIVVAVPFEQFDGSRFYDPSYVREYRTRMLQCIQEDRPGFGLDFSLRNQAVSIQLLQANTARYSAQTDHGIALSITTSVSGNGIIEQCATATNNGDMPVVLPYAHDMSLSLSRASYGQLTEGGPLELPRSHNILKRTKSTTLQVSNPELGAQLLASLTIDDSPVEFSTVTEQEALDIPLRSRFTSKIHILPHTSVNIHASFQLLPYASPGRSRIYRTPVFKCQKAANSTAPQWRFADLITTYILRRNIDYILGLCAIPVNATAVAIIPDHVALPLGWNRDNYWQIHLLYKTYANIKDLIKPLFAQSYMDQIKCIARGHLEWVFTIAQRPNGFYHRSYLVNGRPKDRPIFQLDQQCYPLLELCDFLTYFPEDIEFVKEMVETDAMQGILALLLSMQDVATGLWPTEETPADDAVLYPYHFSSHVLLWRAFTRLAVLLFKLEVDAAIEPRRLMSVATDLRHSTLCAFISDHPDGSKIFAYTTDGRKQSTFYHDANDLPTLFAKDWGFVSTPDEIKVWKDTMAFGLSPANTDGYCNDGPYHGLGSTHSPGAWTLGYFQELAYTTWSEDHQAIQNVWKRILAAMQWDGTFSEAVSPVTATCTSKAYFSWPGAMIAMFLVELRSNNLEGILLDTTTD